MNPYLILIVGFIGGVIGGILAFRPFKMFNLGYKSRKADKGFDCDEAYQKGYAEGNYQDYHDAEQYTKGWNDAMYYIFPESKKAKEIETVRKNLKLLKSESEGKE